jgi:poly-gamma-glutamate synthesis protein (capsule biosynthesis protein)
MCTSGQIIAGKTGDGYDFHASFEQTRELLVSADLAVGNLETLVADDFPFSTTASPDEKDGRTKYLMNAPTEFLVALRDAGFDVLTLANNHIFDYRAEGITQTLENLDALSLLHTGAYATESERQILITEVNGIHVALLAYTRVLNVSTGGRYGFMVDAVKYDAVEADIEAARAKGADFVIVFPHWGKEDSQEASKDQRHVAGKIAAAGADLILGSHPHCIQPVEIIETDRGSVPVFYSMGNFITNMGRNINRDGVIVSIVLEKLPETGETVITSLSYTPTICLSTEEARYVIYPADSASIAGSSVEAELAGSRERTLRILKEEIANIN